MKRKRKHTAARSLRQQFHSERGWMVPGVLKSCRTKLNAVANLPSTLPNEREELIKIVDKLELLYERAGNPELDEISYMFYQERKERENGKNP